DRIAVGEVRGAEVVDLFRALNTGHDGGFATVHANSVADVMARLEALGTLAGLSPAAVRTQALAAIDAVVHLERSDGRRRVSEIAAWPTERGRGDGRGGPGRVS
ncbi:MAG: ATPase, T2SS/T4P/T4SS family, partial [Dermatophilaceae bacterium]